MENIITKSILLSNLLKVLNKLRVYIENLDLTKANVLDLPSQATDQTLGTIKLNPDDGITLNASGQLNVAGRMGGFGGTTGIFAPNDREPRQVGDYSLLVTDAKGMEIGNRAFALVSGYGVACKSAAAGATQYRITNNYANRIIAKMCEGGYAALNEESSKASKIILQIVYLL